MGNSTYLEMAYEMLQRKSGMKCHLNAQKIKCFLLKDAL